MAQLVFAYLPIVFLIFLMTKPNGMPSFRALPLSAFVVYLIVLMVFQQDVRLVHAAVIDGLLLAWTPITIIAGAIFLFRTMEATGALATVKTWLNSISANPVAQLLIVGWAFQFIIEGASGFGTPAAIAAPVLVGLGFPAVRVAIFCLALNSVPVSFGAVGTPTWFGLSVLALPEAEIAEIGIKAAWMNGLAAFPVVVTSLLIILPFHTVYKNLIYVVLAILACVAPYILIAYWSFEFPALIGGLIGFVLCIVLAQYGVGLVRDSTSTPVTSPCAKALVKATFPLWGAVLLLILTRVPQLGIKPLLQLTEPSIALDLGTLGTLSISAAFVVSLQSILATTEAWSHSLLYVPSIIPFVVIALITFALYSQGRVKDVAAATADQMKRPTIALLGALVFVNLMMMGNETSLVTSIGQNLAEVSGEKWQFFAAFLGALGSFFSGSATISNLTFGAIQQSIAQDLQLNTSSILALQSVGAAMGNMVCINNIVAVASVLAIGEKEGFILKRTVIIMLIYGVFVGIVGNIVFH